MRHERSTNTNESVECNDNSHKKLNENLAYSYLERSYILLFKYKENSRRKHSTSVIKPTNYGRNDTLNVQE